MWTYCAIEKSQIVVEIKLTGLQMYDSLHKRSIFAFYQFVIDVQDEK